MWKVPPLTRPSTWLCLLGSILALVAFFLPYYTPPPDSSLPPASLGDCLTSCDGLDLLFQQNTGFGVVTLVSWALLLALLSIAALAFLALFLRSPRWNILTRFLNLTSITLASYLFVSLLTLYITWIDIWIASRSNENPNQETLHLIAIGSWLIPVGLLLTLTGGILLTLKNQRQNKQSALAKSALNSGDD